jgi:hypothetical protein
MLDNTQSINADQIDVHRQQFGQQFDGIAKSVEHYWIEFLHATDLKIAAQQELIQFYKKQLADLKKEYRYSIAFKFENEGVINALLKSFYKNLSTWEQYQASKGKIKRTIEEQTGILKAMRAFRENVLKDPYTFARWLNTHHRGRGEQTLDRAKSAFKEFSGNQLLLTHQ